MEVGGKFEHKNGAQWPTRRGHSGKYCVSCKVKPKGGGILKIKEFG